MSRHYLQQWGHYKHQIDERIARPHFLENLAHSAGGIINLLNNIKDTSLSDWSKGLTPSGKPLLTPEEQVKFKQALDPYVDIIRSDSFQQGGEAEHRAAKLVSAIEAQLTQNMVHMGQHNVVMRGGGALDDIDALMQKLAVLKRLEEKSDTEADVPVYAGISVPLRTIIATIYVLLDTIRMLLTMGGFDEKSQILSLMVGIMDVLDGEWKRSILSFIGYIGPDSFWIGQFLKIFLVLFHNVTPSLMYASLNIGQSAMMYWSASLLQIFSPLPIRQEIMKLIAPINAQNKALLAIIEQNKNELGIPGFSKDNPNYSEYLKDDISWSTLYVLIDYLKRPEYTNSSEVIEFRTKLEEELAKVDEKQRVIVKPLLQFVGFLPIPSDAPKQPNPQPFVANVLTTMKQKIEADKGKWMESISKTVRDAVEGAKAAVERRSALMEGEANNAENKAASVAASNAKSVAPVKKSFFSQVTNAVEGLKPKPSELEQATNQLKLLEVQSRIKELLIINRKRNSELAALGVAEPSAPIPVAAAPSEAQSAVAQSAAVPIAEVQGAAAPSLAAQSAAAPSLAAPSSAAPVAEVQRAAASSAAPIAVESEQVSRSLPSVIGKRRGGRSTRRLRASKKSPRQRVRE
jgi:hypothetical protein